MSKADIQFTPPPAQLAPTIASFPASETPAFPLALRCCLCFKALEGYEHVTKQTKGPALCRICAKGIGKRAKLRSKQRVFEGKVRENGTLKGHFDDELMVVSVPTPFPSDTIEKITKTAEKAAISVNCLHCGHTYDSQDALWQHMKTAKLRLFRQADMEKRCEWLEVVTGLLENEFTGPTSLLIVLEPGSDVVVKRKSMMEREKCSRELEGDREFAVRRGGKSGLKAGFTEENWYLIPETEGKSPQIRSKRTRTGFLPTSQSQPSAKCPN